MSNKNITFKADLLPCTTAGPYNLGSNTQKWQINGVADPKLTDTTYSTGTTSTAGLTKLYTSTGTATDGTMTQSAIKSALDGKAASSHNHSASNITSGTLPIARGGTGATTVEAARTNLGITNEIVYGTTVPTSSTTGSIYIQTT